MHPPSGRAVRSTIFPMKPTTKAVPLERLMEQLPENYTLADRELIQRAYRVAEEAHREQRRHSGEPYINHCLAVATILADLRVPPEVVAAGLRERSRHGPGLAPAAGGPSAAALERHAHLRRGAALTLVPPVRISGTARPPIRRSGCVARRQHTYGYASSSRLAGAPAWRPIDARSSDGRH